MNVFYNDDKQNRKYKYMKIKELHIEKLYGKYNFLWQFDEKVNILAGRNGAFKSTLLNIITHVCRTELVDNDLSRVRLLFSDNYTATFRKISLNSSLDTPQKKEDFLARVKHTHPELDIPEDKSEYDKIKIILAHYNVTRGNEKLEEEVFKNLIKLSYISTFDVVRETKQDESQLDAILKDLQVEYGYYLSDLAKQVGDFVASKGSMTMGDLSAINQNKDEFIAIVNEVFAETKKVIDPNESKLTFTQEGAEKKLSVKDLSSGEKQMLIILLTVLLQKREEYIVIMDEPEISLHIHWQYSLIDYLLRLNPNAQFILSTHSPSIFGKGWGQKVVYAHKIISTANE